MLGDIRWRDSYFHKQTFTTLRSWQTAPGHTNGHLSLVKPCVQLNALRAKAAAGETGLLSSQRLAASVTSSPFPVRGPRQG